VVMALTVVTTLRLRLPKPAQSNPASLAARFVGSESCRSCHSAQVAQWRSSQHHDAMAEANEQTVLGNFAGTQFRYAGITSEFFRRDGKFFVRTDGPDGRLSDFEIRYTFGVYPLQQYLTELAGGRLQALSIAWDTRPADQGGQRWFHLYPGENIRHDHELHWSRPSQNWNAMCADCHSTALRKNYDAAADRFRTRWSEISVGCEACHGPGSKHLAWARQPAGKHLRANSNKGLSVQLTERRGASWKFLAATGNATRSQPRTSEVEIEVCAQCHSRRSQIADGYEAGKPFLDYYRPALLTRPYYHADGQQQDEAYTWGSFLQSRMYARGVTCSDCHDPHSGKPRAAGNAVCASCHLASKYDAPAHHHHQPGSAGAACTACHMPPSNYMVIDPRHDHSLRVPRPDLSVQAGTPNACTSCHTNRGAVWAAATVRSWLGREPRERDIQPTITRATALADASLSNDKSEDLLAASLYDVSPLVRLGALRAIRQLPLEQRERLAAPLLADPVKAIRIEAAGALAAIPAQLGSMDSRVSARAIDEFLEAQRYNADRADARVNLGTFYAQRGQLAQAAIELHVALKQDPFFIPAYVNLADVYRAQGRDADAEQILRAGLARAPRSAVLHHVLGLVLVRRKQTDSALVQLERAAALEPDNPRYVYVHAVTLHSSGRANAAIVKLEQALAHHPANPDILSALTNFHREQGAAALAQRYAEQLRAATMRQR
jgi:Tfp pilus assembly protein PilF